MKSACSVSFWIRRAAKVLILFGSAAVFAQVVPPSIFFPSQDQAVPVGSTVTFSVNVAGTAPFNYRWFFGTQALPYGDSTLTLTNVTSSQSGEYSVFVSNAGGFVTSAPASLVVLPLLPGMLDLTFNPSNGGANGVVRAIATNSDGRIYIGGEFTTFDGVARGHIARLNQDGTLDSSFSGIGTDYSVYVISVQTNQQVLIGGAFSMVDGTPRNLLARLNTDGTLDASFNPTLLQFGAVWAIAIQNDGKILIGGDFTSVAGSSRNRIARLNSNGTLDTTFEPGNGMNDSVRAIVVQPDNQIVVGGAFTFADVTRRNRIARLTSTGSVDPSFDPGNGANYWVNALALQPDGKVILGGGFNSVGDVSRNSLARLNSDGTLDTSFNQGTGPAGAVTSMALQPDGKLVIGGTFSQVNQQPRSYFARLTGDGGIDDAFYSDAGANYIVESVALQSDGRILIGGTFQFVNGIYRGYAARLIGGNPVLFAPLLTVQPPSQQTVGEGDNVQLLARAVGFPLPSYRWQLNGTNLPGANTAVLRLENVRLANAGNYRLIVSNSVGSVTSRVATVTITPARVNPGAVDLGFYGGSGPNNTVTSLSAQSDGRVLIAGYFNTVDGVPRTAIARLNPDGSLDGSFQPSLDAYVNQIAALPSGRVLIGGPIFTVNGIPQYGIALLTTNGTLDTSFRPQFQYYPTVYSFLAQTNSQIVVAGTFIVTNLNGLARTNLARLNSDGTVDPTFNAGFGANGYYITSIAQADGKIILAGNFAYFNDVPRNNIVRLNSDGSVDATFNPGSGANAQVNSLAVQPDGKILLAGAFRSFNGIPRHQVARLNSDGTLDLSFDPGEGPNAAVKTVLVQSDGKIMIGGGFTNVNDESRNRVARLNSDGSLDLTFDPGEGANDLVYSIVQLQNGKLMVGGAFTYFDSLPRPFIVRLLGGNPPAFPPIISRQPESLSVQAGEDVTLTVLASGLPEPRYQWQFGGTNIPGATLWTLTLHNVRSSNAGAYSVIVSNALGTVPSATATLTVNAPSRNPGAPDISFYTGLGPNDRVHAIAVQGDGGIVIGGAFTEINGTLRNHIARLTRSGSLDTTFDPGVGADERVFSITLQPDGRIIAGGSFTNINNVPRNRVVRFETNGTVDVNFNPGLGPNAEVYAVAMHTNGSVLIGGRFSSVSGATRTGIARLRTDGSIDSSFVSVLKEGAVVFALAVQPDGKIVVGGNFFIGPDSVFRSHLTRLNADGSLDPTFTLPFGAGGIVAALDLQDDGKVLLGGGFFSVGAVQRVRVARLHTDGAVDLAFTNAAPNNIVNALQVQPDGKVVIGGTFTNLGALIRIDEYGQVFTSTNYARFRLARLETNGVVDTAFNVGSGVQGGSSHVDEYGQVYDMTTVLALAREADGKILVGGDFTRVNGIARPYIVRLFSREASDAVAVLKGQGMVQLHWDTGVLQVSDQVNGPWTDVPSARSPHLYQTGEAQKFFRLKFN